MSGDIRVICGVPSHGEWKAGFGFSLARMVTFFTGSNYDGGSKLVDVVTVTGSILPQVRHQIVAHASKADATHLLWLDSDMVFPSDTLHRLLSHGKMVVGANYVRRKHPFIPTAYVDSDEYVGPLYTTPETSGLTEVSHVGTGCVLMNMDVFDAIETPFFMFTPQGPENLSFQGEDVYLCHKLRAAGIKLWVDQDLSKEVLHVGEFEMGHVFADSQRAQFASAVDA